jgi:hypothetical protein
MRSAARIEVLFSCSQENKKKVKKNRNCRPCHQPDLACSFLYPGHTPYPEDLRWLWLLLQYLSFVVCSNPLCTHGLHANAVSPSQPYKYHDRSLRVPNRDLITKSSATLRPAAEIRQATGPKFDRSFRSRTLYRCQKWQHGRLSVAPHR